jgi:large subunit ribosomal protein L21
MTYAIVKTGGKQYKVKRGDNLDIEKIDAKEGDEISLSDVLLTFNEKEENIQIGSPTIKNVSVKAKVIKHEKGKKITVVKYKPKIRYKKTRGHRQIHTRIEIIEIATKN